MEKENVRAESKIQYYWGGNRAKLNNIQCRIIEVEGENSQSKEEAKRSGFPQQIKIKVNLNCFVLIFTHSSYIN